MKIAITNNTNAPGNTPRPLRLPKGPTIQVGKTRIISAEDWAKKEGNLSLRAWYRAGAILLEEVEDDENEEGAGPSVDVAVTLTEAEAEALTKAQLTDLLNTRYPDLANSGLNKAELVALVLSAQAAEASKD